MTGNRFTSRKLLVTAATLLITVLNRKYGFGLSETEIAALAALAAAYVGAQSWLDGKETEAAAKAQTMQQKPRQEDYMPQQEPMVKPHGAAAQERYRRR